MISDAARERLAKAALHLFNVVWLLGFWLVFFPIGFVVVFFQSLFACAILLRPLRSAGLLPASYRTQLLQIMPSRVQAAAETVVSRLDDFVSSEEVSVEDLISIHDGSDFRPARPADLAAIARVPSTSTPPPLGQGLILPSPKLVREAPLEVLYAIFEYNRERDILTAALRSGWGVFRRGRVPYFDRFGCVAIKPWRARRSLDTHYGFQRESSWLNIFGFWIPFVDAIPWKGTVGGYSRFFFGAARPVIGWALLAAPAIALAIQGPVLDPATGAIVPPHEQVAVLKYLGVALLLVPTSGYLYAHTNRRLHRDPHQQYWSEIRPLYQSFYRATEHGETAFLFVNQPTIASVRNWPSPFKWLQSLIGFEPPRIPIDCTPPTWRRRYIGAVPANRIDPYLHLDRELRDEARALGETFSDPSFIDPNRDYRFQDAPEAFVTAKERRRLNGIFASVMMRETGHHALAQAPPILRYDDVLYARPVVDAAILWWLFWFVAMPSGLIDRIMALLPVWIIVVALILYTRISLVQEWHRLVMRWLIAKVYAPPQGSDGLLLSDPPAEIHWTLLRIFLLAGIFLYGLFWLVIPALAADWP